jgi:hypothetical protein
MAKINNPDTIATLKEMRDAISLIKESCIFNEDDSMAIKKPVDTAAPEEEPAAPAAPAAPAEGAPAEEPAAPAAPEAAAEEPVVPKNTEDEAIVSEIRAAALKGVTKYQNDINNPYYEFFAKTWASCDSLMKKTTAKP